MPTITMRPVEYPDGSWGVELTVSDMIADDLFPTVAMYTVVGGSAAERENRQRGSGEFRVLIRGKSRSAILDGWGLYSQTPQKMMQEINELSFEYEV